MSIAILFIKPGRLPAAFFVYTNHTLLSEALETWPIDMLKRLLPRHLDLIYLMNEEFLKEVRSFFPHDDVTVSKMSLVDDAYQKIRMAHLAIVGSRKVNGVAVLHTQILRQRVFPLFDQMYKDKFINETNGITPRRWLLNCNPKLADFITKRIGSEWTTELTHLEKLQQYEKDQDFITDLAKIKKANKKRLAKFVKDKMDLTINPDHIIDSQIKRIHEYKRQLLNILQVIDRYNQIKAGKTKFLQPKTVIFAGKAAPGYFIAKQIIHFIHAVARVINHDKDVKDLLQVIFIPNYNVSAAEIIIPGTDISEQISTAGMEASGTGNMKFALNGALTIGTLDGANVEIKKCVGEYNIFIFGLEEDEIYHLLQLGYNPKEIYESNPRLKKVIDMIQDGFFSPDNPLLFRCLLDEILYGQDRYMVLADFDAYIKTQELMDKEYADQMNWHRKALLNIAHMGPFSSDHTIHNYANDIWQIEPLIENK